MNHNKTNRPEDKQEPQSYIPASPVKRTLAWIGIVYMVIVVALTTYIYSTGKPLNNLAPLLTVPALVGLGIMSVLSWRTNGKPGKWPAILIALVCWAIALFSIPLGIVGLMSNFDTVGVTFVIGG